MWTQDGSDLAQERSSKVRYGQARKHGTGFFISNRPAVRLFGTLILALNLGTVLVALDSVRTAIAQTPAAGRERNLRECSLAEKHADPDPDEGSKTGASVPLLTQKANKKMSEL